MLTRIPIVESILPDLKDFILNESLDNMYESYVNEARGRNSLIEESPRLSEIVKAINDHKYVGFYYNDDEDSDDVKSGFRLVEPYVFGYGYNVDGDIRYPQRGYLRAFVIKSTKVDRNEKLSRFNRKSVSKSERRPYWRLFRLDRIRTWQEFPIKIPAARYRYNPDDQKIANIITAAKYKNKRIK